MDGIFIKIQNILKIIVWVIKFINFKTKMKTSFYEDLQNQNLILKKKRSGLKFKLNLS